MDEERQETNPVELALGILGRRKWLALVIFLAAFSAVVTTVTFLPEVYESSATVLVERQQIPDELVRSTVTSVLEIRLNTISQEILSRSRLEELIERFGLYEEIRNQQPMEAVLEKMRGDIKLELRGSGQKGRASNASTVAFTISFAGRDPQQVAAVTNTLASLYIEENLKVREQQSIGTSQFLRTQLEQMKESLEAQEQKVSQFKDEYAGQLPHQQDANLSALEQLNTRLRMNADDQIRVSERLAELEDQLAEADGGGEGPNATAARIAALRNELRELRKTYSDKYPDVIRVKTEIANLVEELRNSPGPELGEDVASGADPQVLKLRAAIGDANVELRSLKAEADTLRGSMGRYQQRVENAPRREQEYQVLMRDYDTSKNLYGSLLERQKEAELAESMEQRQKGEQFRIIEPAFASEQPAAPDRLRLILVGLVLSLGLSGGAVFLAEQLDTSFHTVNSLREKVALPVLISIPRLVTRADKRRERVRFGVATVSVIAGLVLVVGSSYYFAAGNESIVAMLLR